MNQFFVYYRVAAQIPFPETKLLENMPSFHWRLDLSEAGHSTRKLLQLRNERLWPAGGDLLYTPTSDLHARRQSLKSPEAQLSS